MATVSHFWGARGDLVLDTVRLTVNVPELSCGDLLRRGWDVTTRTSLHGGDVWASCQFEDVRLHFGGGIRWLTAECSLPGIVSGDNAQLLDWDGCKRGLDLMRAAACDAAAFSLPELRGWRVTRCDPVWAWAVDPTPYVGALRFARLPRTQARAYGSSVDWVTSQGHRVRCRFYDKGIEAGHDVELPARLERQVRPRREVVRLPGGDRLGCDVDSLEASSVQGVLRGALTDLGLDKPIPSVLGLRGQLVEVHGRRRGLNLWRVLLEARAFGGWPGDVNKPTLARWQRLLSQADIRAVSLDGELPALTMDQTCP